MGKIKDIIKLIRIKQWYKNTMIFLSIIFGQNLGNTEYLIATIFGFFALCFISSSNYVINDIFDRKKDANNPEKKNRPIAAGRIKVGFAIILAVFLFGLAVFIALNLSWIFLFFALSLFGISQLYTFKLKHIAFADVLTISVNFVIRTVSGVFILSNSLSERVSMSYWLVLCPFFLALFLASSKRQSEVIFLSKSAKAHRKVLGQYTKEITFGLMIISTTLLIAAYSIYVITGPYPTLIFTLPFVLYVIFKLFYYADKGEQIARKLDMIFENKEMVISLILILIITFVVLYGQNFILGLL